MALDFLFQQIQNAISSHAQDNGHDHPAGLLETIGGLFGQHAQNTGQDFGNIAPSSSDPYGDPADQEGGQNIRSASQDPYGDPADQH